MEIYQPSMLTRRSKQVRAPTTTTSTTPAPAAGAAAAHAQKKRRSCRVEEAREERRRQEGGEVGVGAVAVSCQPLLLLRKGRCEKGGGGRID